MSDETYRSVITHIDGTPIFQTAADRANEREIAGKVAKAFGCNVWPFGALCAVDWWAERGGRMIGALELKSRSHTIDTHPSVFLNVRKWSNLINFAFGLGVPGIFVVRFTDCVRWVPIVTIDASKNRVAGCTRIVKSRSDIEPVIDVPVSTLKPLPGDSA